MKLIKYSIFTPTMPENAPSSWYNSHNLDTGNMDNIFTESDGNIDDYWNALTATDGTGGYLASNLVRRAVKINNGEEEDSYTISPKYNFASLVVSVLQGAVADPVSGQIIP